MLYFVARVGLVGRALEFLGRIGLGLGLIFGSISPVNMICKYVCVRALEEKRLKLLTPNLVDTERMSVAGHVLTLRSKGQGSRSRG